MNKNLLMNLSKNVPKELIYSKLEVRIMSVSGTMGKWLMRTIDGKSINKENLNF